MRILLYSGKGGVGKTSLAAATAVRSARLGKRTLVLSTDSAHSLADALDLAVGPEPTPVEERLDAVEVDVNQELSSHWGVIHEWLTEFMTFEGIADTVAEELAILPGLEELFSLMKVKTLATSGRYDVVIVDCAPTGDTVRMLAVPEIMSFYFSHIFPIQRTVVRSVRPVARRITGVPLPRDNVFGAVKGLYAQMGGLAPLLQDPKTSSIRIVLNPESMVIRESRRLSTYLGLFGFPVDAVVANKVLPKAAQTGYFAGWAKIQAGHLQEARESFDPLPFFEGPLFDREVVGPALLHEFALSVFGREDPTRVLYADKPVELRKERAGYALYLRLPFAEKDQIQVFTRGDDLVIQVNNQRRTLLLPRTLASRRLLGAAFADGRLRVAFGGKEKHA